MVELTKSINTASSLIKEANANIQISKFRKAQIAKENASSIGLYLGHFVPHVLSLWERLHEYLPHCIVVPLSIGAGTGWLICI